MGACAHGDDDVEGGDVDVEGGDVDVGDGNDDNDENFVLKAGRSSWTLAGGRAKRHIGQVNKEDKREKRNKFMNKHKQNRVGNHERLLQLHHDIQREFELIKLVGTIFLY